MSHLRVHTQIYKIWKVPFGTSPLMVEPLQQDSPTYQDQRRAAQPQALWRWVISSKTLRPTRTREEQPGCKPQALWRWVISSKTLRSTRTREEQPGCRPQALWRWAISGKTVQPTDIRELDFNVLSTTQGHPGTRRSENGSLTYTHTKALLVDRSLSDKTARPAQTREQKF